MENKQPAMSITSNMFSGPKIIELTCKKEDLKDHKWLFGHIPWCNHDGAIAKVSFKDPIDLYGISLDGWDTQKTKLLKVKFDNVLIMAMHGFAGNSYSFTFKLKDEEVFMVHETNRFGYSEDEVKKDFIDRIEAQIKGFRNQIKYSQKAIENIKKIKLV